MGLVRQIVYDWRVAFTGVKWKQTPTTREIQSRFFLRSVLAWVLIFDEFTLGQHSDNFSFSKECLGFFVFFLLLRHSVYMIESLGHEHHFEVTKLFENNEAFKCKC